MACGPAAALSFNQCCQCCHLDIFKSLLLFFVSSNMLQAPRSSAATKQLKIGAVHVCFFNLPWSLRTKESNIAAISLILGEPPKTLNGYTRFLAQELTVRRLLH